MAKKDKYEYDEYERSGRFVLPENSNLTGKNNGGFTHSANPALERLADLYPYAQDEANYWDNVAYQLVKPDAPKAPDKSPDPDPWYGGGATTTPEKEPWNPTIGGLSPGRFTYGDAPSYIDPYRQQIDTLSRQILGRQPFSYDPASDPLYAQYAKSYGDAGRRAMQDTLAQVSARTGGLASSYAGSASQQAYNNYMARLADKVPELQQLAYQMYLDGDSRDRNNLSMLRALSGDDYGRFQDTLSQWNADRSYDTSLWRYGVEDDRYADETAYERNLALAQLAAGVKDYRGLQALGIDTSRAEAKSYGGGGGGAGGTSKSDARSRIDAYLKMGGSLSALDPELLEATGLTVPELLAYSDYYASQIDDAKEAYATYPRFQNEVEAKNWLIENGAPSSALREARDSVYGIKNERDWLHDKHTDPSSAEAAYDFYEDYVSDKAAFLADRFGIDPDNAKSKKAQ